MGRRKFRLSRLPKNFERKYKWQRTVGRPCKKILPSDKLSDALSESCTTPEPSCISSSETDKDSDTAATSTSLSSSHETSTTPEPSYISSSETDKDSDTAATSTSSSLSGSSHGTNSDSSLMSFSSLSSPELSSASIPSCVTSPMVLSPSQDKEQSSPLRASSTSNNESSASCEAPPATENSPLHLLVADFVVPEKHWAIQCQGTSSISVYKISNCTSSSLGITHCVRIESDLTWSLSVHGSGVDAGKCDLLSGIPRNASKGSLVELLKLLDKYTVCPGNPDEGFIKMVEAKKGRLMSKNGTVSGMLDSFSPVFIDGQLYVNTVRASTCEMLVDGRKCASCISYRNSLRTMYRRWLKQKSLSPSKRQSTSSKINMRWLSTPEKSKRYAELRGRLDAKSKEVKRLKERVNAILDKNNVPLDPSLHSDFKSIMHEMSAKVREKYAEDSFKRLFWEEQLKLASVKNSRQIRWHPAIIKWCLHLKFISSGAYHALRGSGLITLPSERTLRDYTHFIRAGVGFIPEVDAQLVKEAAMTSEKDRYVVLL